MVNQIHADVSLPLTIGSEKFFFSVCVPRVREPKVRIHTSSFLYTQIFCFECWLRHSLRSHIFPDALLCFYPEKFSAYKHIMQYIC